MKLWFMKLFLFKWKINIFLSYACFLLHWLSGTSVTTTMIVVDLEISTSVHKINQHCTSLIIIFSLFCITFPLTVNQWMFKNWPLKTVYLNMFSMVINFSIILTHNFLWSETKLKLLNDPFIACRPTTYFFHLWDNLKKECYIYR